MTTSVGPKGTRLGRRRAPRQTPATNPPHAPLEGRGDPVVWGWRARLTADRLYLAYRDEGRALGVTLVTAAHATSTGKRVERATKKLFDLGARDVPASVLQRVAHPGLKAALRALAQSDKYEVASGREATPQATLGLLHDAVMEAEQAIVDYSVTCSTAQAWGMSYGLWAARLAQAQGKALATPPDTRTVARRDPPENGKPAVTITASVWKDTTGVAATCAARAEYALEMMFRCEDRYREEERRRAQARRVQVIKAQASAPTTDTRGPRAALEQGNASTPAVVEAEVLKDDSERGISHGPRSGEEHGAAPEHDTLSASSGAADDLATAEEHEEPSDAALKAFIADQTFDAKRGRMVPAAIAARPIPNAASGTDWKAQQDRDAEELRRWDRALSDANHTLRMRGKQR